MAQSESEEHTAYNNYDAESVINPKILIPQQSNLFHDTDSRQASMAPSFMKSNHMHLKTDQNSQRGLLRKPTLRVEMAQCKSKSNMIRDTLTTVPSWLLLPDDKFAYVWKVISFLLIIYGCTITPYKMAFQESDLNEPLTWVIIDYTVDALFLIDMIIEFFSAQMNDDETLILDKKKIAINYLKGWFWLDLIAIFPFTKVMQTSLKVTSLAKLARLPRLYKLIKIVRYNHKQII